MYFQKSELKEHGTIMLEMIQQIFIALISVVFAKWLDKMWDGEKSSQYLLTIQTRMPTLAAN